MNFRLLTLATALASAGWLTAADPPKPDTPTKSIRLPEVPAVLPPAPAPQPASEVSKLSKDQLYVIDSDVPLIVLSSPAGVVSLTTDDGPVKIRGKFVDGSGKVETKTYKGKYVYTLEAATTGEVELFVIPQGVKDAKEVIRRTLDVNAGEGPQPPPEPDPKPPGPKPVPVPDDEKSPFEADGLRMLIVYDTSKVLTSGQLSAINSKKVRDYLDAKTPTVSGAHEYRVWEPDETGASDSAIWQAAAKRTKDKIAAWKPAADGKGPQKPLPWVMIGNGKTGYEGPLPGNEADMLKILAKFGEGK